MHCASRGVQLFWTVMQIMPRQAMVMPQICAGYLGRGYLMIDKVLSLLQWWYPSQLLPLIQIWSILFSGFKMVVRKPMGDVTVALFTIYHTVYGIDSYCTILHLCPSLNAVELLTLLLGFWKRLQWFQRKDCGLWMPPCQPSMLGL